MTRVGERRIAYLAGLNEAEGLPNEAGELPKARSLAQLEHAPDLHGAEAQLLLETPRRSLRCLRT